jgi:EAL domain-containing protein (putative c-di-GMP-specific phosphodiesterase class I)
MTRPPHPHVTLAASADKLRPRNGSSLHDALAGADSAVWVWREGRGIEVRAEPTSRFASLGGHWQLDDFAAQFAGLSAARLRALFGGADPKGRLHEPLESRSGMRLLLTGMVIEQGRAHGLFLSEAVDGQAPTQGFIHLGADLDPAFQPIACLKTGALAGFEALARWAGRDGARYGPRDGDLSQGALDGLAPLMIARAGAELARWRETDTGRALYVTVNVSGAELEEPGLIEAVRAVISAYGLPPRALRLELTEHAALRDTSGALGVLAGARALGAGLVLDDFAAGHSSLLWLADAPADGIKIDPNMTARMGHPRADAIVRHVVALAGDLALSVTAEGVEDLALMQTLKAMGCDFVQGYGISLPLRAEEVMAGLNGDDAAAPWAAGLAAINALD